MKALRSFKRLEPEAKHAFFSLSTDISKYIDKSILLLLLLLLL
jgi:hypothetical protein